MSMLPDLLHPVPTARVEIGLVREALRFAFAGGGSDVTTHARFEPSPVAGSSWTCDHYERDLFLTKFVEANARVKIDGQVLELSPSPLYKLLREPPLAPEVARFRHHVLHELAQPALRSALEQSYLRARQLLALLGESSVGYRLDLNRRRIDILLAWRALVEQLAAHYAEARSGLHRLHEFGCAVQETPGFARMRQLLDVEASMATLDVRLGVDYAGELRNFEIVGISERRDNPFYATRWGRLLRKLRSFLRGFRFSDSEVLSRFVDEVFAGIEPALARLFQLLGDLEFYLAALHFRDRAEQQGVRVCMPSFSHERSLEGLFNPLLLASKQVPTPCSLPASAHFGTSVLTGPNSGGKTRLLQSLAYAQLLGQCGFYVPAERASLIWAESMFVSISEGAQAEQREGRLGMELLRIRSVFESAKPGAFVVIDELCSGTNPGEGEQIFELVLSLLRELEVQAFVSTHFLQFARRLSSSDAARRWQLAFLQVELDAAQTPTYQFVPGVAESSLALLTAARLGVTQAQLSALVERQKRAAGRR